MDHIIIHGGYKLQGKLKISGSKNAALPIIAATLLADKPIELHNIPTLVDVNSMLELLGSLGVRNNQKKPATDPVYWAEKSCRVKLPNSR